MPRKDRMVIVQHQHLQRYATLYQFVNQYWRQYFTGRLRPYSAAVNNVVAYINHGRWVADCPEADCNGAMIVTVVEPFFMCIDCGNPGNNENWYRVTFPSDRIRIEQELLKRPGLANRNWLPGETFGQLQAENVARGIP